MIVIAALFVLLGENKEHGEYFFEERRKSGMNMTNSHFTNNTFILSRKRM